MSSQHSEAELLSSFLLPPAPLPMALSYSAFKNLFPDSARNSQDIPVLYRELQHQVSLGIDDVKRNIAAEVQRSEETRTKVRRARRRMDRVGMDELGDANTREMDVAVSVITSMIYKS
jgi:centromere-localized protein 2